ncbi:hypothetical protein [Psychrobacter immobilis]|uniref:hypothetical protein n=1 Tax=Psychrobacter immobilis TaxID=498 RepID=UPI00191B8A6E|nr:hypothetical protein [Psychrobacter immobilis]
MNDHLDLTVQERSLIDNSLRIAMKENDKSSVESRDELIKKYHQDSNLGLFELRSKIKSHDLGRYEDLSLNNLKLITNCLMLLDDFTYQKSLEEKEKDKVEYYKNFELQMSALRKKLSAIESHTMYSGLL